MRITRASEAGVLGGGSHDVSRGAGVTARAAPARPTDQHLVWDLPVRAFHWLLAISIVGAYVTHRLGIVYFHYHLWFGYAVLVLVSFRLVWGVVGTRHARFAGFVRGPRQSWNYLRAMLRGHAPSFAGHNPLGALMVLLLLALLLAQAGLGMFANDEIASVGPLYGYVSDARSLVLTSLHRKLFDWIAIAVGVHVVAVLAHGVFKKEWLVRAMITGRKNGRLANASDAITSSRLFVATALVAVIVGALYYVITHAPEAAIAGY